MFTGVRRRRVITKVIIGADGKPGNLGTQNAQEEGVLNGENTPDHKCCSLGRSVRLDPQTWQWGVPADL